MKKIAFILYTQGLEYDDRIRKEILSLTKMNPELEFNIFAILPQNKEERGITEYGVRYYIPYLKTREKYPSGNHTLYKAFDFFNTIKPHLKDYDIIWCADVETFIFPLLIRRKPLVWDLHEIPSLFLSNFFTKLLFNYIERKVTVFYHANQNRIDYLMKQGLIRHSEKHTSIRNYPEGDLKNMKTDVDVTFEKFSNWLGNDQCAYIQGINNEDRYPIESVSSIMECNNLKAVVVGGINDNTWFALKQKYGDNLDARVFLAGKVAQKRTKLYIDKCAFGLVFYQQNCANNTYCEPNRMFQSIMMCKPIIVGNNPPMKELVLKYNFGVVLDNDGSDVNSIVVAINRILENYNEFYTSILNNREYICWENQENTLNDAFKRLY